MVLFFIDSDDQPDGKRQGISAGEGDFQAFPPVFPKTMIS
jgi:hypothetical protein